jgi:calpain-7
MSKADFILEQALVLDETGKDPSGALKLYLDAVEAYFAAKASLSSFPDQVAIISKRIKDIIERAEALKAMSQVLALPDAPLGKGAPSIPTAPPSSTASVPKANSKPATGIDLVPTVASTAAGASTSSSSLLSKRELDVLRRSSHINGKLYYPWNDVDYNENFIYPTKFTDPEGCLPLSKEQMTRFEGWLGNSYIFLCFQSPHH